MEIKGERIIIKALKLDDVFYMKTWGKHKNPLLEDYNFPEMTDSQIRRWYSIKTRSFANKYFAICLKDGSVIGYMGMKEVKILRKESTLGIVLDPAHVNKGYGTEALKYFLRAYFTEMNMKRMYLEVAEFNKRASTVYKKMGFTNVAYYMEEFFDSNIDTGSSFYEDVKSCFVISDGRVYNYVYKMKLDREVFLINNSKIK